MNGLDADEILGGIRQWVDIESPSSHPGCVNDLMDVVQAQYEELGGTVERIAGREGRGDHLSIRMPWGGDGPGIVVLSHLDTVHPVGTAERLPFRVEGDKAFGPGIYDMKGGAHLAFCALRDLVRRGRTTPLPIRVLYVSDEEVGSPTSRHLIEELGSTARFVLVTEPARDGGQIVTSRKGTARFVISFAGRPSHSGSRHHEGRSAVKEMARQILALEAMTDYGRDVTVNVGIAEGGTGFNVVPEAARIHVDVRLPTLELTDEYVARVRALTPVDPDVSIDIQGGLNRPPFEANEGTERLFQHARGLAADIGFELRGCRTGGGSDGNFTWPSAPTLDGLGVDGDGAHTLHEHLLVSSLVPRATLMQRLFETLDASGP